MKILERFERCLVRDGCPQGFTLLQVSLFPAALAEAQSLVGGRVT